jgi:lipid-binding SYLF domain-containing protein
MKTVLRLFLPLGAALVAVTAAQAADRQEVADRLNSAVDTFQEIMATPDKAIPQDLLDRAQCVVIVPGVKKGAFLIGAEYGKGFFSCRRSNGQGWTAPGSVIVEGGSFGFQIGGEETDVVMLVMNQDGERRLLSSQFKLGADASIAAGPVGRSTQASTDLYLTAEILSWSRSRGVFAGISLAGATVRQNLDDNRLLYGRALSNQDIIEGNAAVPAAADRLVRTLDRYSPRKTS